MALERIEVDVTTGETKIVTLTKAEIAALPKVDPSEAIRLEIARLEASVTDRRWREAFLGKDNGWLANVDAQIMVLRNQL